MAVEECRVSGCAAVPQHVQEPHFWFAGRLFCATAPAVMPHKSSLPAYARSLKEKLSNPSAAAAFIRNGFPADVGAMIRWDQLRLVPGTFTDESKGHQETDLLFAAPFAENEVFIYLYFDLDPEGREDVVERVRSCMDGVAAMWVRTHGSSRPQPVIMPAIVPVFRE